MKELSGEVLRALARLRPLLEVKADGKRALSPEERARLIDGERILYPKLAHRIHEHFGAAPLGRDVALSLLRSYLFSGLYAQTVGPPESVLSSLPLRTFPLFEPPAILPARTRLRVFRKLCDALAVHPEDRAAIERDCAAAQEKLKHRAELSAALCEQLETGADGRLTHASIHALFGRLFPGHPLLVGEIDLVATGSGLYFYISSKKNLASKESFKARDAEGRKQVRQYLRRIRDFQFENYLHFPMFGSFDARDADRGLIGALLDRPGAAPREAIVEALNSAIAIEETESLEKYLIHDAWGHLWQGDLTDLKRLFTLVAELKTPLSADEVQNVENGKLAFADLFRLDARGECEYDAARADAFIESLLRERASWFLAPVCAELCADMVEYFFARGHATPSEELPTSSVFSHRPGKLDFAWSDMRYYVTALTSPNACYRKEPRLRSNFVRRLQTLLKIKYPHRYRAVKSAGKLERQLDARVLEFFEQYQKLRNERFATSLEIAAAGSRPRISFFFELFVELCELQATLNSCIQNHMDEHSALGEQRMVLVFFVVHFLERNPMAHFHILAEAVARDVLPFLKLIREFESGDFSRKNARAQK